MDRIRNVLEALRQGNPPIDPDFYRAMAAALDELDARGIPLEGERRFLYALSRMMFQGSPGELYTPRAVVRLLVELLQPDENGVYDPCCGSGAFLLAAGEALRRAGIPPRLYGRERSPAAWSLSRMNLALRELEADLGDGAADALREPPGLTASCVLCNPPFDQRHWSWDGYEKDPRWRFGVPPRGNANFAYLQMALNHLEPKGRMGILLPNNTMEGGLREEQAIRRALVEADCIEAVLQLPGRLFFNSTVGVCLWLLRLDKPQPGRICFVDGRDVETVEEGEVRALTPRSAACLLGAVEAFRAGAALPREVPCAAAGREEVAALDFTLMPAWYINGPPGRRLWSGLRGAELVRAAYRMKTEEAAWLARAERLGQ